MLKRLMHMMVLLVFVLSTMPGVVIAFPMTDYPTMHHNTTKLSDHQHNQHHALSDMSVEHSCCNDEQTRYSQNEYDDKLCCHGDCQCVMNDCAKSQSLYPASLLFFNEIFQTFWLTKNNQHHDDFILYLLERPPKA